MKTMLLKMTRRDEEGNELLDEAALKAACANLCECIADYKMGFEQNGDVFCIDVESPIALPALIQGDCSTLDMLCICLHHVGLDASQVDGDFVCKHRGKPAFIPLN